MHPLANVDISGLRDGLAKRKLYSCSGDTIDIDLEAKGNPPLSLNYLLSYGSKFENKTREIQTGRSKLEINVPKELNAESGASGKLSVTLLSITDGDGRIRKLPAPTVEVDIHRQKPTVRFAKTETVTITEGESARAPLRLTGDAPWEVEYTLNGGKAKKISLRDANNHLTLRDAGVYRLTRVKDANCPGVVAQDDTFEIAYKARPKVQVVCNPAISVKGNTYRHKGFCTGGEDQVALRFEGEYTVPIADATDGQDKHHTRLRTDTRPVAIPVNTPSSLLKKLEFSTFIRSPDSTDTTFPSSKIPTTPTTLFSSRWSTTSIPDPLHHSSSQTQSLCASTSISNRMPRSASRELRHSSSISLFGNPLRHRSSRTLS